MFDVIGSTVITPRPRRAATALAPSLLTMTAGRRLLASEPRPGSKSTTRISPRRIRKEGHQRRWTPTTSPHRWPPIHARPLHRPPPSPKHAVSALPCGRPPTAIHSPLSWRTDRESRHPPRANSRSPSYSDATIGRAQVAIAQGDAARRLATPSRALLKASAVSASNVAKPDQ